MKKAIEFAKNMLAVAGVLTVLGLLTTLIEG